MRTAAVILPKDRQAAIDFAAHRRRDGEALITHEISLDEVSTAGFDLLSTPGSGALEISVRIGGES